MATRLYVRSFDHGSGPKAGSRSCNHVKAPVSPAVPKPSTAAKPAFRQAEAFGLEGPTSVNKGECAEMTHVRLLGTSPLGTSLHLQV